MSCLHIELGFGFSTSDMVFMYVRDQGKNVRFNQCWGVVIV